MVGKGIADKLLLRPQRGEVAVEAVQSREVFEVKHGSLHWLSKVAKGFRAASQERAWSACEALLFGRGTGKPPRCEGGSGHHGRSRCLYCSDRTAETGPVWSGDSGRRTVVCLSASARRSRSGPSVS